MSRRHTALRLAVGLSLAAVLALPQTAGAAGTVGITGTARSGDILTVTGTSTYTDQPFVLLGDDATGDAMVPAQNVAGQDLTAASVSSLANGGLALRWTVASFPPAHAPGIVYGWTFCVNDATCYEVDVSLMNPASGGQTLGNVWRCADASCAPAAQTLINSTIRPTVDTAAKTITMNLSASLIGVTPNGKITPVGLSTMGPVFTGNGDLGLATYFYNTADGVPSIEDFIVAGKQVSVAVGAPGTDPSTIAYTTSVAPAANGSYSAAVNVAGQSGERAIYVRACLGSNNCAYSSQAVSL